MKAKNEAIINPIVESLKTKYSVVYGVELNKQQSFEFTVLEELESMKQILPVRDALLFSCQLQQLESDLVLQEQKVWRLFLYSHLVFLYGSKVLKFHSYLLRLVCDSITREDLKNDSRFLDFMCDSKWMMKIFEQALYVDFSSTLTSHYQVEIERVRKVFFFLCRRMEETLAMIPKETDLEIVKHKIMKQIKTYQSKQLFKRSVDI